jgi:FlaG/FlaF family flagellin (archaellin)
MTVGLRRIVACVMVALVVGLAGALHVSTAGAAAMTMNKVSARLSGADETPPNSSAATGSFQGTIASNDKAISYRLTFSKLSTRVTMAHIHVGAKGTAGPVVVWFCGGGGRPACPANGGTLTGTVTASRVVAGGDIKKGDIAGLIKAIQAGNTYVNVHSTKYPAGEIRGQIEAGM